MRGTVRTADRYESLEEVQEALRRVRMTSCNLIIGIDYSQSNIWSGVATCGGRSLHYLPAREVQAAMASPSKLVDLSFLPAFSAYAVGSFPWTFPPPPLSLLCCVLTL